MQLSIRVEYSGIAIKHRNIAPLQKNKAAQFICKAAMYKNNLPEYSNIAAM